MPSSDKRSYNNADLTPVDVAALKKKSKRVAQVHLRVGSRRIEIPAEAFLLLTDSGHAFVRVQPINAVVQAKADSSFEAIAPKDRDHAVAALKAFRPKGAKKAKTPRKSPELPDELMKMLAGLPRGYKLALKPEGYALVKSRTRGRKQAT
ncbi:MAG: hypothetical protein JST30_01480 [Armatimonadetes bacterium]|nr:hypothetical protein [Armatimonadota bacterium]